MSRMNGSRERLEHHHFQINLKAWGSCFPHLCFVLITFVNLFITAFFTTKWLCNDVSTFPSPLPWILTALGNIAILTHFSFLKVREVNLFHAHELVYVHSWNCSSLHIVFVLHVLSIIDERMGLLLYSLSIPCLACSLPSLHLLFLGFWYYYLCTCVCFLLCNYNIPKRILQAFSGPIKCSSLCYMSRMKIWEQRGACTITFKWIMNLKDWGRCFHPQALFW